MLVTLAFGTCRSMAEISSAGTVGSIASIGKVADSSNRGSLNEMSSGPWYVALTERPFIMFDMPGIGESPDPAVPYNPFTMAWTASRLLSRFGIEVADVMGVSWGGAMAQHFALQHPKRTRRLVLAATTPGMLMVPGNPAALTKMADPRRYMDPAFMEKHFKTLYGGAVEGKDGHIGRIKPPSKTGYFYQLLAMMGWTSAPFLPFLKTETLIMMGGDDQIVPMANGKFLKFLIPNSELVEIEDGGHLFLLSHVDESIAAIKRFLDRPAQAERKAA